MVTIKRNTTNPQQPTLWMNFHFSALKKYAVVLNYQNKGEIPQFQCLLNKNSNILCRCMYFLGLFALKKPIQMVEVNCVQMGPLPPLELHQERQVQQVQLH